MRLMRSCVVNLQEAKRVCFSYCFVSGEMKRMRLDERGTGSGGGAACEEGRERKREKISREKFRPR